MANRLARIGREILPLEMAAMMIRKTCREKKIPGQNTPSELSGKLDWYWDRTLWEEKGRQDNYTGLLNSVPGPSKTFILIDEHEQSIDDGIFTMFPIEVWAEVPADRHNQGCNLSFVDAHAESHRWQAQKKFKTYAQPIATTDSGKDRRDWNWLQELILWVRNAGRVECLLQQ